MNQKSDRPRTLSDGGLLCDVLRGIGLNFVQSFPSELVVVPFEIVRVDFFCFIALEKQVDGNCSALFDPRAVVRWIEHIKLESLCDMAVVLACSVSGLTMRISVSDTRRSVIFSMPQERKLVPRMASVSVTLKCKIYEAIRHCTKHQLNSSGAERSTWSTFDQDYGSLSGFYVELFIPSLSHFFYLKKGRKLTWQFCGAQFKEVCKILWVPCTQYEGEAQPSSVCSYAVLLHSAIKHKMWMCSMSLFPVEIPLQLWVLAYLRIHLRFRPYDVK